MVFSRCPITSQPVATGLAGDLRAVLVQDIVRKPDKVDAAVAGGDTPARLVVIP